MSASNSTENDILEMVLKGTDPAWRSAASGYFALFAPSSRRPPEPFRAPP